ncbi:MAG: bifunctional protein-serine/threonine kinase/phosphatase, partial [Proteobacteria bacterium]|nr:bifunctional protein-serine/threonine kinase/phosphatase [Pseudomonadota bacterium]
DKALRKAVQVDPDNRYEKLSELESDLRKPNPEYLREEQLPLLERNPLQFWKMLSTGLFIANIILLYLLSQ